MDYMNDPHNKTGKYYKKYNKPNAKKVMKRYNERDVQIDFPSYYKTQLTPGCNDNKEDFYQSRFYNDNVKSKMNEFIEENKDKIINLYKGTVMAFNLKQKNGKQIPSTVEICLTKQNTIIINFCSNEEDTQIISGCTIALFKGNEFIDCSTENTSNLNRENYKKILNSYQEWSGSNDYEQLKPSISEIGHVCDGKDNCKNDIIKKSLICESCDFDLCPECRNEYHHEHLMFEYNGYYGWDTFEIIDIIHKRTVHI
ncbi:hypothetical protein Klosneuvirus_3_224 [Klosneuvirus KNV1]|uniref:Uncharacterized protein n=1 Tax=Klosneuvirus KNV1 TaxID=1977640 RepID=A0A1V0SK14_9VIRU|nr:hypothetical protein Klosneuvirus_3_224 [Klosneuvirus KNV1]